MEQTKKFKLSVLGKRIEDFFQGYRQNVAIFGDDSAELVYLLDEFFQNIERIPANIPVIRIASQYSSPYQISRTIGYTILSQYFHERTKSLDELICRGYSSLPTTVEHIKCILQKKECSFADVLKVVSTFLEESGQESILVLEELTEFQKKFSDFCLEFSRFIVLHRNCMIIATSSYPKECEKLLSTDLNLLFGNFEREKINEVSLWENSQYIYEQLADRHPSSFLIAALSKFIGGNVVYVDVICKYVRQQLFAQSDEQILVSSFEKALFCPQSFLFQKYMRVIDLLQTFKNAYTAQEILYAIGQGYRRKTELYSRQIASNREICSTITRLIDSNIIDNLGDMFVIKDSLFSFWLTHAFRFFYSPYVADKTARWALQKQKILETLTLLRDNFTRSKQDIIVELFGAFRDDSLRLGKQRFKLPCVEQTKVISQPDGEAFIIIAQGQEIVFAGFKDGQPTENDMFQFVEQGRNITGKKVKKIFMCTQPCDSSTKLIAKNNKLMVWDGNIINRLFDVYNIPYIFSSSRKSIEDLCIQEAEIIE